MEHGQKSTVPVTTNSYGGSVLVSKSSAGKIEQDVVLEETLTAPVTAGQEVGMITYRIGEQTVAEQKIVATEDVPEVDFGFVFSGLFRNLIGLTGK